MKITKLSRKTNETEIKIYLNLEGKGKSRINTGIGFFNHMLELFSKNSLFDLEIESKGDLIVDDHHTVEDIGIVIGEAIQKGVGNKNGISRYGTMILPMDELLALVSLDFAGRFAFVYDVDFTREKVGDMSTELVYDFFKAVAENAKLNLHIKLLNNGRNDHHRIEAIFKAFGRAIRNAIEIDDRIKNEIPSTKGVL